MVENVLQAEEAWESTVLASLPRWGVASAAPLDETPLSPVA